MNFINLNNLNYNKIEHNQMIYNITDFVQFFQLFSMYYYIDRFFYIIFMINDYYIFINNMKFIREKNVSLSNNITKFKSKFSTLNYLCVLDPARPKNALRFSTRPAQKGPPIVSLLKTFFNEFQKSFFKRHHTSRGSFKLEFFSTVY